MCESNKRRAIRESAPSTQERSYKRYRRYRATWSPTISKTRAKPHAGINPCGEIIDYSISKQKKLVAKYYANLIESSTNLENLCSDKSYIGLTTDDERKSLLMNRMHIYLEDTTSDKQLFKILVGEFDLSGYNQIPGLFVESDSKHYLKIHCFDGD